MSRIQTFVLAMTLALTLVKAAASPIEGAWEGTRHGAKVATMTVTQDEGKLGGSVVFYIIRDDGDGSHNGQATPAVRLQAVQWDQRTLRFQVAGSNGEMIPFELRLTGEGKAELRRAGSTNPDEIVPMVRLK